MIRHFQTLHRTDAFIPYEGEVPPTQWHWRSLFTPTTSMLILTVFYSLKFVAILNFLHFIALFMLP